MRTLEEITTSLNLVYQHQNVLPSGMSITPELTLGLMIFVPIIFLIVVLDNENKYFPYIIPIMAVALLLLTKAYMLMLILFTIIGALYIIYTYPKYNKIKMTIDRFF